LLASVFLLELFLVPETLFDRQAQLVAEQHPSVTGDGPLVTDEKAAGGFETIERAVEESRKTMTVTEGENLQKDFTRFARLGG
jgi:hypothetical protein